MSGRDLYALYVAGHENRNFSVDAWEELHERDREVWDEMAENIRRIHS